MLWFGLHDSSKILIVAFSVSLQIVISTYAATRGVEKELLWSARSLGANEREILREIVLPAALPQILTGLQIAVPVCLIIVVVTEMVMGGRGLGDSMLEFGPLRQDRRRVCRDHRSRTFGVRRNQRHGCHSPQAPEMASRGAAPWGRA